MNYAHRFTAQQRSYEYVELQATEPYREDYGGAPVAVRLFSVLLGPVLLLALLFGLYKLIMKPAISLTKSNTKVIEENNELMRENITLQREILEAMRKSADEM